KFSTNIILSHLDERDSKSHKEKESALKRLNKADSNTNASKKHANALQTQSEPNAIKESIGKESKGKDRIEEEKQENFDFATDNNSSNSNIPKPNSWGVYSSMEDLEKVLLSHQSWQADFGKSLGVTNPEDVPKWISKFFSFCKGSGKYHEKESEAKSHCHAWTRRQIELGKNPESTVVAISQNGNDSEKPMQDGSSSGELVGKWIWLNNGWRD